MSNQIMNAREISKILTYFLKSILENIEIEGTPESQIRTRNDLPGMPYQLDFSVKFKWGEK